MSIVREGECLTSLSSGLTADLTNFTATAGLVGSILLGEQCRDGVRPNVLISGLGVGRVAGSSLKVATRQ